MPIEHASREANFVSQTAFQGAIDRLNVLNTDEFQLIPGDQLSKLINVKQGGEPHESDRFGVYLIYGITGRTQTLLYIGKAGTVHQNRSMGKQGLHGRITNKQEGMLRQAFFEKLLTGIDPRVGPIDGLRIKWFETYRDSAGTPPFQAEADLLAAYLTEFRKLPPLNKEA